MDQVKIGNIIKKIRTDNNLTQQEFADLFGVTYQAVSKWENGKNIPDISVLKLMSKKFNISFEDLLNGKLSFQNRHGKKVKLLILLPLLFTLVIGIILILLLNHRSHDHFEFKQISASCENFEITGSMAYNTDKTSIYISKVNYCGIEDNEVYDKITCSLYESSDNINSIITSCKEAQKTTIKDYLTNVNISANNYSSICKKYDDTSLYIEIEAYKNDKITKYKIPMSISDNC